jgi:hypothetical protein
MPDAGSRIPVTAGGGDRPSSPSGTRRLSVLSQTGGAPGHGGRRAEGAAAPGVARQGALLVLAALLAGFTILQSYAPHDEGLMLQAGARIAAGQWPYRDFWTNYMPGQEVVLAGLQLIFGPSLLAWRVVLVATDAVVALLAYRLTRRGAPEICALAAWLAVTGAMAYPSLPGPNPPALLIAFAALLAARRHPGPAGALAGLACCFRLELGVAAVIGVAIEAPRGSRLRVVAAAGVAAVVTLGPFLIAAPGAMWHDTIGFYAIQSLQRLPFPLRYHGPLKPSKLFAFYIPLILVAGLAAWAAAIAFADRARLALRDWSLAPAAIVGLAYLLGRTDEFHLVPLAAVLPVMLARAVPLTRAAALRAAVVVALGLLAVYGVQRRAGQLLHPPAQAAVPGPAGDGVQTSPADARALSELLRELAVITRPGAPIFVADPRFDLVQAGDPELYIITGHPNPTAYDVMQPGVVTTAPVQRQMIGSLERSHTRVVIRWLDPRADAVEPNGSGRSSGVNLLGDWIAAHYREAARYGYYEVLVGDPPVPPSGR